MNDILLDPPPAPQPEKKETVTFNKKNLAIAFLAVALFVLFIVLLIPGDKQSASTTTAAPVVTNPPITAPPANKYDQYMNHVLNNSGQANTWSKAKVIEFGDLVCQALDEGTDIRRVVNLLESYGKTESDFEFFASVVFGAVTYICPEYTYAMNEYIAGL